MCGIVGVASREGAVDEGLVCRMRDRLTHRGPDDKGMWRSADGRLVLAQRRLSIIDLSPGGHQPMTDPVTGATVTFNGEIYNYRELRVELEALGCAFRTSSDTEVLLAAHREWGHRFLEKLNGMFAFGLFKYPLSTCRGCAANPGSKERPELYQWGTGQQLSADRVLQRLSRPLGSGHLSSPSRSQVRVQQTSHMISTLIKPGFSVGQGGSRSTGDEGPGLLRRILGRGRLNFPGRWRFGGPGRVGARARGHSGVRSPRLQDADGAAFLVDGGSSSTSAKATRTARERRRIRRPADHDCRGLARGVRAPDRGTIPRLPASQAGLLPQHRGHVARTGGAGDRGTRPDAVVQVIWCVPRRSRATSGVGRRHRSKFARELGWRFWKRRRSRPGDAARDQPGGDAGLQRQAGACSPKEMPFEKSGARTEWR